MASVVVRQSSDVESDAAGVSGRRKTSTPGGVDGGRGQRHMRVRDGSFQPKQADISCPGSVLSQPAFRLKNDKCDRHYGENSANRPSY